VALRLEGHIDLPAHVGAGGFDHAAIHERTRRLYVAHTSNDAVDVIDCARDTFIRSIGGLRGVAGVLVSEDLDCAFTSNRGPISPLVADPAKVVVRIDAVEETGVAVRVETHPLSQIAAAP